MAANAPPKKTPEDFKFGKELGVGSYSTVYLAKDTKTGKEYAIKVLSKQQILKEKKQKYVSRERDIMLRLDHPFFVRLDFTFQDADRLFFGMNYCKRGELLDYLKKYKCFDEACSRFYAAELVTALEYLHSKNIIHRDLKPENMLLNEDMHIQICDFGSGKVLDKEETVSIVTNSAEKGDSEETGDISEEEGKKRLSSRQRTNSFVGTAQYVSPEVLNSKSATVSSDLWALGCCVYQFVSGKLPFWGNTEYAIFQKILKLEYEFPQGFYPSAKDLVSNLLKTDPKERLGSEAMGGYQELKSHAFFNGIEWSTLPSQEPPIFTAYLPAKDLEDESHYSSQFGLDEHSRAKREIGKEIDKLKEECTDMQVLQAVDKQTETVPSEKLPCKDTWLYKVFPKSQEERTERLRDQAKNNAFHKFVKNNLILHQSFLDKRKGLFARKRMFLLTEGPHLYYVDAGNGELKGELPWSKELAPDCKNFKIFFVHTPKRIYYLEDSYQRNALDWCDKLQQVLNFYYDSPNQSRPEVT